MKTIPKTLGSIRGIVLASSAICILIVLGAPAYACGCGAYIPTGGDAGVFQERVLIRFDGETGEISMGFSVEGRSKEAAWILPVPNEASLSVGDHRLFTELDDLTQPRQETRHTFSEDDMMAGVPPESPSVAVLERQTLGPFDVSTLEASNPRALADWLDRNGYELPTGMSESLESYVEDGWQYVAVRLRPGSGEGLEGDLDPLSIKFRSDRVVYPMRASSTAEGPLGVLIYVLAPHRVEPPGNLQELLPPATSSSQTVTYADWIGPDSVKQSPALEPFVDRKLAHCRRFRLSLCSAGRDPPPHGGGLLIRQPLDRGIGRRGVDGSAGRGGPRDPSREEALLARCSERAPGVPSAPLLDTAARRPLCRRPLDVLATGLRKVTRKVLPAPTSGPCQPRPPTRKGCGSLVASRPRRTQRPRLRRLLPPDRGCRTFARDRRSR